MTGADLDYIEKLCRLKKIHSPVLELGTGYGGVTSRNVIINAGLNYLTTDLSSTPGVDFVANFESRDIFSFFPRDISFGSVLILNVLEHVFEPIQVLDNALKLLRPGGTIVTITPSMWPLHNYLIDCYRLLPDFFIHYAEGRPCALDMDVFEFVGKGLVEKFRATSGELKLPPPTQNLLHLIYSRAIHKLFNTSGRGMWTANHVAIAAVFVKTS